MSGDNKLLIGTLLFIVAVNVVVILIVNLAPDDIPYRGSKKDIIELIDQRIKEAGDMEFDPDKYAALCKRCHGHVTGHELRAERGRK